MRDSSQNSMIKLLYDMYDYTIEGYKTDTVTVNRKRFTGSIKSWSAPTYESLRDRCKAIEDDLKNNIPNFETMWNFCEMIRIAEKIIFYKNDIENTIYVEANLSKNGTSTRKFRISGDKYEIRFTLSDVKDDKRNCVSIQVVRFYGLKMENRYEITDGDIKYEDSSDLYLINEINRILSGTLSLKFHEITDIFDMRMVSVNKKLDELFSEINIQKHLGIIF